jgi:hypothetical protein
MTVFPFRVIAAAFIVLLQCPRLTAGPSFAQTTTRCESGLPEANTGDLKVGAAASLQKPEGAPLHRPPLPQTGNELVPEINAVGQTVHVSYSGGRLRIQANGARLDDIFAALHQSTGTRVSGPFGASGLVSADLCGAPDEVVANLLNGSDLDYIIVLSNVRHDEIEEVILSQREASQPASAMAEIAVALQATASPKGADVSGINRLRYGIEASSSRSVAPDFTFPVVEMVNSGVPEESKPLQTPSIPSDVGASAVTDGSTSTSTEKQVTPAGQYMQEMYRLRRQLPPDSGPVPH